MKILSWFAGNRVAANLLMWLLILGGLSGLVSIRKQVMPEFAYELVLVSVEFPGAAPAEVEAAVCARIEEAVRDLEFVKRTRSVASEGIGAVTVELLRGTGVDRARQLIQARVDAVDSFPRETEKPVVEEIPAGRQVLSVVISGRAGELALKLLAEEVRDELAALPGVSRVVLAGTRPYEISVEVSERALRRFGLTFDEVAEVLRRSSLDLPGGSVKSPGGEILLRTQGQVRSGRELEDIGLLIRPDGTHLRLGEVATVIDGFAETDLASTFDGVPAVELQIFRVADQDVTEIAERVKAYVAGARDRMPEGIELTVWHDDTRLLKSRLDTMLRNGRDGLILVLLVLALFLRVRVAVWVALGIPVSFLGTLWVMPQLDLTIHLISLFGFIVVLGVVVDDAIVVGDNIYRHSRMGKPGLEAASDGVREVAVPVIFSALTTIAAFAPLLLALEVEIFRSIPLIVITTLIVSLVESLLVLPAHLSHLQPGAEAPAARDRGTAAPAGARARLAAGAARLGVSLRRAYGTLLERALSWRYATLASAVAVLLISLGLVAGGFLRFSFFPPVEADEVGAFVTMPQGTPREVTAQALDRLRQSAREFERQLAEEGHRDAFRHVMVSIGHQPLRVRRSSTPRTERAISHSHLGEVELALAPADERGISAGEVARRWRQLTGSIPDAVELAFDATLLKLGSAINIRLAGRDLGALRRAGDELKTALSRYPGTFDIASSSRVGKREVELALTSEAASLGLTLADLARQVRQAFYGEEVQRIQRGRHEVKVMVRYPRAERRSLSRLEEMRIRTPTGDEIPFAVAGRMKPGRGLAVIERTDGRRTVNVTADIDFESANSNEILADLQRRFLPDLLARYPGMSYTLEGEQQEQRGTLGDLLRAFLLALFIIYALLAALFRSYLRPFIVMAIVPFGVIGALWGHVLMGHDLTVWSIFGVVAVTGVVVNDSLVMVDFVDRARRAGRRLREALQEAAEKRFRPIVLTSLTTVAGLTPLLLERSIEAQFFLIPMAISIAFGVLFSTAIVLLLVPVSYYVQEDLKDGTRRLFAAW